MEQGSSERTGVVLVVSATTLDLNAYLMLGSSFVPFGASSTQPALSFGGSSGMSPASSSPAAGFAFGQTTKLGSSASPLSFGEPLGTQSARPSLRSSPAAASTSTSSAGSNDLFGQGSSSLFGSKIQDTNKKVSFAEAAKSVADASAFSNFSNTHQKG